MIKDHNSTVSYYRNAFFLLLLWSVFSISCLNHNSQDSLLLVKNADDFKGINFSLVDTTGIKRINPEVRIKGNEAKIRFEIKEPVILILQKNGDNYQIILHPGVETCLDLKENAICSEKDVENETLMKYNEKFELFVHQADSLSSLFITAQSSDTFAVIRQQVSISFDNLVQLSKGEALNYLTNNASSISIFGVLNSTLKQTPLFSFNADFRWFQFVDSSLQLYHPKHSYSIWLHNKIRYYQNLSGYNQRNIIIPRGTIIPETSLQGLSKDNQSIKFSKNGITLLHLWANDPRTREINDQVKVIYEQYKTHGLNITSVAFDANRKRWASEIELDKMWWTNLIDTSANHSDLLKGLNNPPLPSFIIVDSNRKVLVHFTQTYQLNEWLSQYFSTNEKKKL